LGSEAAPLKLTLARRTGKAATLTVEEGYANAIRYAGEFYDAETGLYYLRARNYNPYNGRSISKDSYWGEDANPLSLNLNTYAFNNPLIYADPTSQRFRSIFAKRKPIYTKKLTLPKKLHSQ
jgi:RHS repeat-associated protein